MQILEDEQLFDEKRRVKNGSMYQVTYLNSSGEPFGSESRYQTTDGLVLGDGDYVYVHKHGLDAYVQADEIAVTGDDKTVYLADPVHRYDLTDLREFVISNFVKLSGGNEISGDNAFLGDLSVRQNLSVGQDLSVSGAAAVKILNVLEDGTVSGNLGVSGNAEVDGDFGVLNGNASFGGDLSVDFARLYDLSGNSFADICADLSCAISGLSGEVSAISSALCSEIQNLSTALSDEIDSLSAELSSKISSRATISVDGERTGEFRFWHISRDDYHDLVQGKYGVSCDPNALYVISSDGVCMYGQQITDLAEGVLSNDAATYGQVSGISAMCGDLSGRLNEIKTSIISAIGNTLSAESVTDNLSVKLSVVVQCLVDIRNTLSAIR